jgi:hypothetical protein
MNALELAEILEDEPDLSRAGQDERDEAAAMLRKQAEAIRKLREALDGVLYWDNGKPEWDEAKAALAATEEFQK